MPPAPTLTQIQSLYSATLTASSRFTSYNFKSYFVDRTHQKFRPIIASLDSSTATPQADPNTLAKFYEEQTKELEVLRRSSEINRMFEGPKLVVEHARPITSGGGAGMEAGAGGGGQPE